MAENQPIPMPPPYGGVNDSIPVIALQSPQCENLFNFNLTDQGAELRNGDALFYAVTITSTCPDGLANYNDSVLILMTTSNTAASYTGYAYNVETGASLIGGGIASQKYGPFQFVSFRGVTFIFHYATVTGPWTGSTCVTWDGSNIGGSYSGTGFNPVGGAVYKRRLYVINADTATYSYSPIDAISGAASLVTLTGEVSTVTTLAIIAPISIAEGVSSEKLLAFVFFSGEVLFYSGSYPDGPDWGQVGSGNIGAPLNFMSGVAYLGDYLVFTEAGVVSLRDLLFKGSEGAELMSANINIQDKWQTLIRAIRTSLSTPVGRIDFVKGVYDYINGRIIISFPYYLASDGTATKGGFFFIFDTIRKAWYYHRSFGPATNYAVKDMCLYKGKVVLLIAQMATDVTTARTFTKEGATDFMDDNTAASETAYDYEIKSAPIANGRAYVQQVTGMDVIVSSDLYSQTNYQLIRDFGVQTTTAQKVVSPGSGVQKPYVNMGIEGSFVQYKISGTTAASKSVGYKLYGTNIWISQGNRPR